MLLKKLKNYNVILASQSPRRQHLLKEMGVNFQLASNREVDETYPDNIKVKNIAEYLAIKKADAYSDILTIGDILITADTVVIKNKEIIGKPKDLAQAKQFLQKLASSKHKVITGVCIRSLNSEKSFSTTSRVYFSELFNEEIDYYLQSFNPIDKAGAYGIQEWIGYVGIEKIKGSFYNVMGLPTHMLYRSLSDFVV